MNKRYILAVAMALIGAMYGCSLEDAIVSCGDSKSPVIGLIDGNPYEPVASFEDVGESSPIKAEHFDYIKRNECPSEWYCVDVEDDDSEIVGKACSLCPLVGQVMCGECVSIRTDRENCGRCGNVCSDYEKCKSGECVETVECKEVGMHASHGECVEDTLEECGAGKVNCTELEGWKTGECQNAVCIAETCEADYALKKGRCIYMDQCDENQHLYGNKCEENDMDNCGVHGRQCKSVTGFEDGFCSKDGECVATSCQENFCNQNGVCHNGKYNAEFCGISGMCTRCKEDEQCENGACIVNFCGQNKHVMGSGDDTTCEEDSIENCGSHGNSCVKDNVDQMACVNGNCEVQKCSDGYHPYDGGCERDDINNCGSHDNQCAGIIANWSTGECIEQECRVKSCVTGHVYNNSCEADDLVNCGKHGEACHFEHGTASCNGGVCKLEKCDKNYFVIDGKCNPNRTGDQAFGGEYIDPWGLVWDKVSRPKQPHSEAVKQCINLGGRLPTPTEIYRNNSNSGGEPGLLNDSAEAAIWTDTVGKEKNTAETMLVLTGKLGESKRTIDNAYRCVWDPVERPITFTGANCHGKSNEDGCSKLKLGNLEYIVDRRDRPEQYWIQAAEECRKMGARLPTTAELYSLIRAGLANGANTPIWAAPTKSVNAATFGWSGTGNASTDYSEKSYRDFNVSIGSKRPFRCVSETVKIVDNKPVFPQTNINLMFKVDALLRMDSSARAEATYFDAAYTCLKAGGHLPSIDEMTAAIRAGLGHDDTGKELYWTSNFVSDKPTTILFTQNLEAPYYYATSSDVLISKSYKNKYRYYCAYRPENDYNLSSLGSDYVTIKAGNVTHYVSKKDIYENSAHVYTFFSNNDYVMRKKGMRLPTDTELVFLIRSGLENGSGELVMTSNPHYYGDNKFGYLGVSWNGRGSELYTLKNLKFSDATQRPYRMYATTVIH